MLLELAIDDRTVRLAPLPILLPGFPAAVGTVRQTACAAGWVLIVLTGVPLYRPLPSWGNFVIIIVVAAVLDVLCVPTYHVRLRREQDLHRVRSTAVALQRQMLRPLPVLTEQVIVDGVYLPAEEDRMVGGDIDEAVASPYGKRLLFGDVQGKGLPAIVAAVGHSPGRRRRQAVDAVGVRPPPPLSGGGVRCVQFAVDVDAHRPGGDGRR